MEKQKLSRSQRLILEVLQGGEALTYTDIADDTDLSYDGVRGRISELTHLGYNIQRIREEGITFLMLKEKSSYKRPIDIKDSISRKLKAVDDFYGMTDFLDSIRNNNTKKVVFKDKPPTEDDRTAVLLLSDLHFGEIIYSPNDILVYNTKMAESRMDELIDNVILKLKKEKINHLYILSLGDMVDGDMIYRNHLFRIEKPAIDQVKDAVKSISYNIKRLVSNKITVEMYNVRGNHGITNYNNLEEDNWDNVVYDMLDLIFEDNENVSVNNFKGSEGLVKIGEKQFVITHGNRMGNQIKTASGLREFRGMCGKYRLNDGDVIVAGHLHEFGVESDQGKFLVRNGSLADASEYAYRLNLYSDPMQTLILLDSEPYPTIYPICSKLVKRGI